MTSSSEAPIQIRAEIGAVPAYRQGASPAPGGFKLSSNENPFPAPESVRAAVVDALQLGRYGSAAALELRGDLADRFGVGVDAVHLGAGSVALLFQLVHAVAGEGDEVITAWPSFEAYPLLGLASGARHVPVAGTAAGEHDLDAMLAAVTDRTRAIILCSPNNPTGPALRAADVARFLAAVPSTILVILDEAYREFVTAPDAVRGEDLRAGHPQLVLLRTFSKAYGLADLRVGYAIGEPSILDAARVVGIPLSVTGIAQAGARAALAAEAELFGRIEELVARRAELRDGLLAQGWAVPDAQGNFVWLPAGEHAAALGEACLAAGILVRSFPGTGVRISVGEAESIPAVLAVTGAFVAAHPSSVEAR